jgi:uncharacterized UBP type Zn finger protein
LVAITLRALQDALEFLQHLLQHVERMEHGARAGKEDPTGIFRFKTEERIQCTSSGMVLLLCPLLRPWALC